MVQKRNQGPGMEPEVAKDKRVPGPAKIFADPESIHAWLRRECPTRKRTVLANGCFDLLHYGHVVFLAAAKAEGDQLVVAVNEDESVRRIKGPGRPIQRILVRMALVAEIEGVDAVFPFPGDDVEAVLRLLRPDVHCKGGDYKRPEKVPEYGLCRKLGIETRIVGGAKIESTRRLIRVFRSITDETIG